jgi:hypothetical protein
MAKLTNQHQVPDHYSREPCSKLHRTNSTTCLLIPDHSIFHIQERCYHEVYSTVRVQWDRGIQRETHTSVKKPCKSHAYILDEWMLFAAGPCQLIFYNPQLLAVGPCTYIYKISALTMWAHMSVYISYAQTMWAHEHTYIKSVLWPCGPTCLYIYCMLRPCGPMSIHI